MTVQDEERGGVDPGTARLVVNHLCTATNHLTFREAMPLNPLRLTAHEQHGERCYSLCTLVSSHH